jgi:hypothetical protein
MDSPANTQSYAAQFLQHGKDNAPTLQEAVQEMQRTGSDANILKYITGIVMMQMTAKAGIKKHGQVAVKALFDKFSQLHDLTVFRAQDAKGLTKAQQKAALRAINVIKEKRCGKIKGRTIADGRAQRNLYTKDETASATVATDALLLSIRINAKERRDVATAEVSGAYLRADMKDFTLLKMEGESVDIMCDMCSDYDKFVCYETGKRCCTSSY